MRPNPMTKEKPQSWVKTTLRELLSKAGRKDLLAYLGSDSSLTIYAQSIDKSGRAVFNAIDAPVFFHEKRELLAFYFVNTADLMLTVVSLIASQPSPTYLPDFASIVVTKDGEITEVGHEELLNRRKLRAILYSSGESSKKGDSKTKAVRSLRSIQREQKREESKTSGTSKDDE